MIRILADALTSPARSVEQFGAAGMPGDQLGKLHSRAARMATALSGSPGQARSRARRGLARNTIIESSYHVEIAKHYYSVPHQLIRQEVEARITAATIEVFHRGKLVASHHGSLRPHRPTTVPEHGPTPSA